MSYTYKNPIQTILPAGTYREVLINRKAVDYNVKHNTHYPVFIVVEKDKPWQEFNGIDFKAHLCFSLNKELHSPAYFYTSDELVCHSTNDLSFLNRPKEMNVLAFPKVALGQSIGNGLSFLRDKFTWHRTSCIPTNEDIAKESTPFPTVTNARIIKIVNGSPDELSIWAIHRHGYPEVFLKERLSVAVWGTYGDGEKFSSQEQAVQFLKKHGITYPNIKIKHIGQTLVILDGNTQKFVEGIGSKTFSTYAYAESAITLAGYEIPEKSLHWVESIPEKPKEPMKLGTIRVKRLNNKADWTICDGSGGHVMPIYISGEQGVAAGWHWTRAYADAMTFKCFEDACGFLVKIGYQLPPSPAITLENHEWLIVNARNGQPLLESKFKYYKDAADAIIAAGYQALPDILSHETPYKLDVVVAWKNKSFHLYDKNLQRFYHVNKHWYFDSTPTSHFSSEESAVKAGRQWFISPIILALTPLPPELQQIAIVELSDGWHIREQKTKTDWIDKVYESYRDAKAVAHKAGLNCVNLKVKLMCNQGANKGGCWYVQGLGENGGYMGYDGRSYGSMYTEGIVQNDKSRCGHYYNTFDEAAKRMNLLGFEVLNKPNLNIVVQKAPWDSDKWAIYDTEYDLFMTSDGLLQQKIPNNHWKVSAYNTLEDAIAILKKYGYPDVIWQETLAKHKNVSEPITIDFQKLKIAKDLIRTNVPWFVLDNVSGKYMNRDGEWGSPVAKHIPTDHWYFPTQDAALHTIHCGLQLRKFNHVPNISIEYSGSTGWYIHNECRIPSKPVISRYMRNDGTWHNQVDCHGGNYYKTYLEASLALYANDHPQPKPNLKIEKHHGSGRWTIVVTEKEGVLRPGQYMNQEGTFSGDANFFYASVDVAIQVLKSLGYEEKWFLPEVQEEKSIIYVSISTESDVRFSINTHMCDLKAGESKIFHGDAHPKIEYMCGPTRMSEIVSPGEYKFVASPNGWKLVQKQVTMVKIRYVQYNPSSTVYYSVNGKDCIISSDVDRHQVMEGESALVKVTTKDRTVQRQLFAGSYEFVWINNELQLNPMKEDLV